MQKSKKIIFTGSVLFSSVLTAFGIMQNTTVHKTVIMDQFLTDSNVTNEDMDFVVDVDNDIDLKEAIGEYSFLSDTYQTEEKTEKKTTDITLEKIADPSQRYRDVDMYLYVNKDINIYKEDNEESEIVKEAEYADYIHKIGNDPYNDDGFSKVEINGEEAYIETQALTSDILFKERNQTIYATEDLTIYSDIDLKDDVSSLKSIHGITMIGESHDIVKVQVDDETIGFISKELISKEMLFNETNKTVWALSNIDLKAEPNSNSETIKTLYKNDGITQIGISEEWSKLQTSSGDIVYTKTKNLTDEKPTTLGEDIANYALQFVGNKYVWGGTSLTNGTDCSGFTQSVYKHFGYNLSRTTTTQIKEGRAVSYSEARPGDLIFYSGHVAIYIGNGQIVHASNSNPYPQGGIKVSSATYSTIIAIRRIVD